MQRFGSVLFFVVLTAQCVLWSASAAVITKREVQTYTTKYDNIDVNSIVSSRRLMMNYANCLLEKGPCSPDARLIRTYLPEALQTECAKCSQRQKEISGIILAHLVQNYKDLWDALLTKYDPEGKFRMRYEGSDVDDDDDEVEEEEVQQ